MRRPARQLLPLAVGSLAIALLGPASAPAKNRHASPDGHGAEPCRSKDPCSLKRAATGAKVRKGDVVVMRRGRYRFRRGSLVVEKAITLRGARRGRSVLAVPVYVNHQRASLTDLVLRQGLRLSGRGDRLVSEGWCGLMDRARLKNTICKQGVQVPAVPLVRADVRLVNVTAIGDNGTGTAISANAGNGRDVLVRGTNVIADGPEADIAALAFYASATIELTYSNFDVRLTGTEGGTAFASAPGSATNQTAPPRYRHSAKGNYRQQRSSPTVDAGTAIAGIGRFDFERDRRVRGQAPDIGADEIPSG